MFCISGEFIKFSSQSLQSEKIRNMDWRYFTELLTATEKIHHNRNDDFISGDYLLRGMVYRIFRPISL